MNTHKPAKSSQYLMLAVIGIVVIALILVLYLTFRKESSETLNTSPKPSQSVSLSPSSLKTSPTSSPSASPSISPSGTSDFYKQEGETYVLSAKNDTNGDQKDETLVINQRADGKYAAYIISFDNKVLYENKDLGQKPLRITTQTYNESDTYPTWMLIFTEQSGNLAFIHWNGQKYEIPENNLGI